VLPFLQPYFLPDTPKSGLRLHITIDACKGLTLVFCLVFLIYTGQWNNPTAVVYTTIHGLYGILWILKSNLYGDHKWEQPAPLFFHFLITAPILLGYWLGPYYIMSTNYNAPAWRLGLSIFLWGFGVFLHFASDLQKHISLTLKPGHLVTTHLWKYIRNPNYFGELMIYVSFLLISLHWVPIICFLSSFAFYWIPNMSLKEKSLSRYKEFADYKKHSWFLVPFVY